jgi:hypothetical protein
MQHSRRGAAIRKLLAMASPIQHPSADFAERLLEAIHMLTIETKTLRATMAAPRPTRRSQRRKVFADYLARLEKA